MWQIKAVAPTVYQHKSLTLFWLDIKNKPDGSFLGIKQFETEAEAKDYLKQRLGSHFLNSDMTEETHNELNDGIIKTGTLTLDAVTAKITEIEND